MGDAAPLPSSEGHTLYVSGCGSSGVATEEREAGGRAPPADWLIALRVAPRVGPVSCAALRLRWFCNLCDCSWSVWRARVRACVRVRPP